MDRFEHSTIVEDIILEVLMEAGLLDLRSPERRRRDDLRYMAEMRAQAERQRPIREAAEAKRERKAAKRLRDTGGRNA